MLKLGSSTSRCVQVASLAIVVLIISSSMSPALVQCITVVGSDVSLEDLFAVGVFSFRRFAVLDCSFASSSNYGFGGLLLELYKPITSQGAVTQSFTFSLPKGESAILVVSPSFLLSAAERLLEERVGAQSNSTVHCLVRDLVYNSSSGGYCFADVDEVYALRALAPLVALYNCSEALRLLDYEEVVGAIKAAFGTTKFKIVISTSDFAKGYLVSAGFFDRIPSYLVNDDALGYPVDLKFAPLEVPLVLPADEPRGVVEVVVDLAHPCQALLSSLCFIVINPQAYSGYFDVNVTVSPLSGAVNASSSIVLRVYINPHQKWLFAKYSDSSSWSSSDQYSYIKEGGADYFNPRQQVEKVTQNSGMLEVETDVVGYTRYGSAVISFKREYSWNYHVYEFIKDLNREWSGGIYPPLEPRFGTFYYIANETESSQLYRETLRASGLFIAGGATPFPIGAQWSRHLPHALIRLQNATGGFNETWGSLWWAVFLFPGVTVVNYLDDRSWELSAYGCGYCWVRNTYWGSILVTEKARQLVSLSCRGHLEGYLHRSTRSFSAGAFSSCIVADLWYSPPPSLYWLDVYSYAEVEQEETESWGAVSSVIVTEFYRNPEDLSQTWWETYSLPGDSGGFHRVDKSMSAFWIGGFYTCRGPPQVEPPVEIPALSLSLNASREVLVEGVELTLKVSITNHDDAPFQGVLTLRGPIPEVGLFRDFFEILEAHGVSSVSADGRVTWDLRLDPGETASFQVILNVTASSEAPQDMLVYAFVQDPAGTIVAEKMKTLVMGTGLHVVIDEVNEQECGNEVTVKGKIISYPQDLLVNASLEAAVTYSLKETASLVDELSRTIFKTGSQLVEEFHENFSFQGALSPVEQSDEGFYYKAFSVKIPVKGAHLDIKLIATSTYEGHSYRDEASIGVDSVFFKNFNWCLKQLKLIAGIRELEEKNRALYAMLLAAFLRFSFPEAPRHYSYEDSLHVTAGMASLAMSLAQLRKMLFNGLDYLDAGVNGLEAFSGLIISALEQKLGSAVANKVKAWVGSAKVKVMDSLAKLMDRLEQTILAKFKGTKLEKVLLRLFSLSGKAKDSLVSLYTKCSHLVEKNLHYAAPFTLLLDHVNIQSFDLKKITGGFISSIEQSREELLSLAMVWAEIQSRESLIKSMAASKQILCDPTSHISGKTKEQFSGFLKNQAMKYAVSTGKSLLQRWFKQLFLSSVYAPVMELADKLLRNPSRISTDQELRFAAGHIADRIINEYISKKNALLGGKVVETPWGPEVLSLEYLKMLADSLSKASTVTEILLGWTGIGAAWAKGEKTAAQISQALYGLILSSLVWSTLKTLPSLERGYVNAVVHCTPPSDFKDLLQMGSSQVDPTANKTYLYDELSSTLSDLRAHIEADNLTGTLVTTAELYNVTSQLLRYEGALQAKLQAFNLSTQAVSYSTYSEVLSDYLCARAVALMDRALLAQAVISYALNSSDSLLKRYLIEAIDNATVSNDALKQVVCDEVLPLISSLNVPPLVVIVDAEYPAALLPGEEFNITLTMENVGATQSPPISLIIVSSNNDTVPVMQPFINLTAFAPGEQRVVTIPLNVTGSNETSICIAVAVGSLNGSSLTIYQRDFYLINIIQEPILEDVGAGESKIVLSGDGMLRVEFEPPNQPLSVVILPRDYYTLMMEKPPSEELSSIVLSRPYYIGLVDANGTPTTASFKVVFCYLREASFYGEYLFNRYKQLSAQICRYDEDQHRWVPIPTEYDASSLEIKGMAASSGVYAIVGKVNSSEIAMQIINYTALSGKISPLKTTTIQVTVSSEGEVRASLVLIDNTTGVVTIKPMAMTSGILISSDAYLSLLEERLSASRELLGNALRTLLSYVNITLTWIRSIDREQLANASYNETILHLNATLIDMQRRLLKFQQPLLNNTVTQEYLANLTAFLNTSYYNLRSVNISSFSGDYPSLAVSVINTVNSTYSCNSTASNCLHDLLKLAELKEDPSQLNVKTFAVNLTGMPSGHTFSYYIFLENPLGGVVETPFSSFETYRLPNYTVNTPKSFSRIDPGEVMVVEVSSEMPIERAMLNISCYAFPMNVTCEGGLYIARSILSLGPGVYKYNVTLWLADYAAPYVLSSRYVMCGAAALAKPQPSVVAAGGVAEYQLTLEKGWNLISIPLVLSSNESLRVLKELNYRVFEWSPDMRSYAVARSIEPCRAYWVYVPEETNITVEGYAVQGAGFSLSKGWSLLGGIFSAAHMSVAHGEGECLIYAWDPQTCSYVMATELLPGEGYWVYSPSKLTILLAS